MNCKTAERRMIMWEQSVEVLNPVEALKKAQENPAKDTNVLTNADRIRAMSDEELAKWLNECGCVCETCSDSANCVDPYNRQKCINGVLNWGKQPAEE